MNKKLIFFVAFFVSILFLVKTGSINAGCNGIQKCRPYAKPDLSHPDGYCKPTGYTTEGCIEHSTYCEGRGCEGGCDISDTCRKTGGGGGGTAPPCRTCSGINCNNTGGAGCSSALNQCINDCDCGADCSGGGSGCTKVCNSTDCDKVPAGCSNPTNNECETDVDCGAPPPPSPSCTVALSPDPALISQDATQSYTASVVPSNGAVSQVNFTSSNTSVATVSPASDATSAYNTIATGQGAGTTTLRAGVIMAGSEKCFDTATLTVSKPDPWWQVMDADVLTLGNLISQIPETLGEDFILNGSGGFPGVAIFGGTIADFSGGSGSGTVSSTGWLGNTTMISQKNFDYKYFAGLIPGDVIFNEITSTSVDGATFESGGIASRGYYWYRFDGTTGSMINQDLTITSAVNLGSRKVILLVKGANLNIGGDINVTNGAGTFVTIVGGVPGGTPGAKGSIIVDPNVGSGSGPDLEGIYFADSQFQTGSKGVDADDQLYVRGAVAAYDGMVLERDLVDDSVTPAEFFEYGLDQMLLYPPSLSVRKIRWKEVAP